MTSDPLISLDIQGGVATITLNRPDQRNAFDGAMTQAFVDIIDRVEADPAVRVSVLAGAGPVFCAGMDLKAFSAGQEAELLFGPHGFAGFVKRARRKPIIAAVHGAALAGGFEIMLACDLVVTSEEAVFGLPEVKLGLLAGGGAAIGLARRIPRVLANEMLLTGATFSAADMQRWGVVNRVVAADKLSEAAQALAASIAANAPLGVQKSLGLSDRIFTQDAAESWAANDAAMVEIGATDDVKEGVTAFLEKRAPDWKGR